MKEKARNEREQVMEHLNTWKPGWVDVDGKIKITASSKSHVIAINNALHPHAQNRNTRKLSPLQKLKVHEAFVGDD